jgi:hypothetical protein
MQAKKISLRKPSGILILISFIFLSIFATWPLILNLNKFYSGFSPNIYDTPQFVFRIHYYEDSIRNGKVPLTINQYFYPEGINPVRETLVLTYSILGGVLGIITNLEEIIIHNLIIIFFLSLSCFSLFYLILEFTNNKYAAFIGAMTPLSSKYLLYESMLGHPNTVQIFWIILIFILIEKIIKRTKEIYGIFLGMSLSLLLFSSYEYFIYLTFIAPIYLLFRKPQIFYDKKILKNFGIAILIFLLTSFWYIRLFIGQEYRKRSITENLELSIRHIKGFSAIAHGLFLSFAILGMISSVIEGKKHLLPFIVIFIFSLIYSLGPFSKFSLQYLFLKYWPFVNAFRTPYRILTFSTISVSIFVSIFVQKIYEKSRTFAYLLIFIFIFSINSQNSQIFRSSYFYNYSQEKIEFYKNISKIPGNFSIVEYPENNCFYLYHIIFHKKYLINGCASEPPQSYYMFMEKCDELLNVSDECLKEIKKVNLKYAIYHSEFYPNWNEIYNSLNSSKLLTLEGTLNSLFMFRVNG